MTHSVYSFNIHRKNSVRRFQSYIRTEGLADMKDLHNQFSIFLLRTRQKCV